jgi:hypothetical protein
MEASVNKYCSVNFSMNKTFLLAACFHESRVKPKNTPMAAAGQQAKQQQQAVA